MASTLRRGLRYTFGLCVAIGTGVGQTAAVLDESQVVVAPVANVVEKISVAPTVPAVALPSVAENLRRRFTAEFAMEPLLAGSMRLKTPATISQFYAARSFQPAWLESTGANAWTSDLLQALASADREGLQPADYRIEELQDLLHVASDAGSDYSIQQWADLELRFTNAWFSYASHLLMGRVNPRRVDREWGIQDSTPDLANTLNQALEGHQPIQALATLVPPHPAYARLRQALDEYRNIEKMGGWTLIAAGPKLAQGARGARVQQLRRRLLVTGDLQAIESGKETLFDKPLTRAVKRFQQRHGLADDGVVGPVTLKELNVPVTERLTQLALNLERWRWLPEDLGARHIQVNITNYTMSVIEQGQEVFGTKVIVGKSKRPTPVFNAEMSYLVLNPAWHVPSSIAVKDKLPKLRRNAYALSGQRIKVFAGGREIDPGSVNWRRVSAKNFPYRLRQDPGPRNALGRVKFMFPNRYSVYLHDTPSRSLFRRSQRAYSSGCIRVAEPMELAEYLLKHDARWTRKAIRSATRGRRERTVHLPEKIPVYLLYWTAWVSEDGAVQFRKDIYQRDQRLVGAWIGEKTGA